MGYSFCSSLILVSSDLTLGTKLCSALHLIAYPFVLHGLYEERTIFSCSQLLSWCDRYGTLFSNGELSPSAPTRTDSKADVLNTLRRQDSDISMSSSFTKVESLPSLAQDEEDQDCISVKQYPRQDRQQRGQSQGQQRNSIKSVYSNPKSFRGLFMLGSSAAQDAAPLVNANDANNLFVVSVLQRIVFLPSPPLLSNIFRCVDQLYF